MKNISESEKKLRKLRKELNSLKNKLSCSNLIWFNSLTKEKQFDFLIDWKKHKYLKSSIKTPIKRKNSIVYPANLKYFIIVNQINPKYMTSLSRTRNSLLNYLLNDENR